jgi:putative chitinase
LNVDLINNPSLASDKKLGAELAVLYFKQRGLISLSEKADFKEITRRINGGYNGYADRVKHYKNILNQYEVEVQV